MLRFNKFNHLCSMSLAAMILVVGSQLCGAQSLVHHPIVVNSAEAPHQSSAISLPAGFRPQRPPSNPMLYPPKSINVPVAQFNDVASALKSDWIPIHVNVPKNDATRNTKYQAARNSKPPMERLATDRLYVDSGSESNEFRDKHRGDSIVYGSWKVEHPRRPVPYTHGQRKKVNKPPNGGSNPPAKPKSNVIGVAINKHQDSIRDRLKAEIVPNHSESSATRQRTTRLPSSPPAGTTQRFEIINVHVTDPKLVAVATQINHSIEITLAPTFYKRNSTTVMPSLTETPATTSTTQTPPLTMQENSTTPTPPWTMEQNSTLSTHFLPTTIRHYTIAETTTTPPQRPQVTSQDYVLNFNGDSSQPPIAFDSLNIPDSFLPQLPKNITKIGVPYEKYGSQDEMCVPFTLREQMLTDDSTQYVDVERVYCFPLPLGSGRSDNVPINRADTSFELESVRNYARLTKLTSNLLTVTIILRTILNT